MEPDRKPKVTYTDNSLEFGKACEDLSWNHCTSTPHRSETNGIAERAVRRVKEGTSTVLLQSGLNENWWADSMECYTYLRNVTDLLSDGKTPYERRFGQPFKGPIIPFGSLVEYHPVTAKDQSRIYQFGKKVLPGLFLGYALYAERIWKGDVLVADLEELETMDASEIYSKRLNAKEVIFPKEKGEFIFQSQMDESNFLGGDIKTWEHPPWYGSDHFKERVTLIFLENQKGLFHHLTTHFRMLVKRLMMFGPCQETSFSAITLNPESNFTRREKNHSLFHWSTLTYPELLIRIWMSSKRNASTIIGMLMVKRLVGSLDRFHPVYFIGRKTSRRKYVVKVEINEKTAHIQARSLMARNLENNGERMPSWRRSKSGRMNKLHLDNARKLQADLFHWPGG